MTHNPFQYEHLHALLDEIIVPISDVACHGDEAEDHGDPKSSRER